MERKKALDGGRRIKYPVFVCMCVCMCVRERGREKRRRRACGCLVSLYLVDVSFYFCDRAVLSDVGFSFGPSLCMSGYSTWFLLYYVARCGITGSVSFCLVWGLEKVEEVDSIRGSYLLNLCWFKGIIFGSSLALPAMHCFEM